MGVYVKLLTCVCCFREAYIVYRTKDAAYAAAKEYSTQTIELDEEVLKIYKYHVPQDQTPRGILWPTSV